MFIPSLEKTQWKDLRLANPWLVNELKNDSCGTRYPAIFYIQNNAFAIPYRIGYHHYLLNAAPSIDADFQSVIQQLLLTRNPDGYIREKAVKRLLKQEILENYAFVTPYLLRLIGEYVREIWQLIYVSKELFLTSHLDAFIACNDRFLQQNLARTITYTCEYYQGQFDHYQKAEGYQMMRWLMAVKPASNP